VNIELTDVTRTFGRNKAIDGVSLAVAACCAAIVAFAIRPKRGLL
jgi:hypothetical protein